MTKSDSPASFVGDIPRHYDAGLGPNIFDGYARDLATRTAALDPTRVLELAAGTGILTRHLRDTLPHAEIVATDLNQPMLEFAATKFSTSEPVVFRAADATDLDEAPSSFDTVVCQFGVMFFPDKRKSFAEALEVLKPGGRYLFNVWGTFADNPFAHVAYEVVAKLFPSNPPQFYRTPFGYNDIDLIRTELTTAGFHSVEAEAVPLEVAIHSIEGFATGLVFGNPLFNEIQSRGGVTPRQAVDAIAAGLAKAFGPDPARMPLKAIVFDAKRSSRA